MVLVCAPGHPLVSRKRVHLSELHGHTMVSFDRGLTIRREVDRALHQHRAEVRVVMEFDNIETIKRAIEIDAGVGLLPLPTIRSETQTGTLHAVPISGYPLVRPIGIIHRRGKDLSQSAVRFIDLLREESLEGFTSETALPGSPVPGSPAGEIGAVPGNGAASEEGPRGQVSASGEGGSGHDAASSQASASQAAPPRRGGKSPSPSTRPASRSRRTSNQVPR